MIETALFWTCCLAAVIGAIGAATLRNLFHAALLLGLSLVGIAGLYLFLESSYLACIQVVVYLGGILVLVLFATLFSADIMGKLQQSPWWLRVAGLAGAALASAVAARLAQVAMHHAAELSIARTAPGTLPDVINGKTGAIGDLLVGSWLVPFFVVGLLLTVALVGAVATVRRFRKRVGAKS
ncbi:MAG: NADH-quinone oxidoreductase subunit J [Planctomycetota bacterium]